MSERLEAALFVAILLVAGGIAWWLMLRPVDEPDPSRFDALPSSLEGWRAVDVEMDQAVSEMLNADRNVQRAYVHPQGYVIFVYVGYYGTERGGTPEHTPDVCYPAQGWQILERRDLRLGGRDGFSVREFLVEREGQQRLVHFWYRTSHATGITSVFGLRLQHFWGRLIRNRGDGALVRLSTRVTDGDRDAARTRLRGLDLALETALEAVWGDGSEGLAAR